MAQQRYTRINTLLAEQFLVASLPWPSGVVAVGTSYVALYPNLGLAYQIHPGDYIVATPTGSTVVPKAVFELDWSATGPTGATSTTTTTTDPVLDPTVTSTSTTDPLIP